ncbi:helix-turn-helix transcriptional regulator [Streptomyces sp. NPDC093544]|uniref:helix-turn-helix domain-containing protein n=1 Tax=Streptomyces sp. NPDC093544 TaxID=3155200 RepID=UPI003423361C
MASLNVGNLGEYLREQRRNAQLSLRQLADAAGVSNPYLSQIERGLRKPSAEVLQQVAKALRISAETLYVRAGILDAERDRDEVETRAVILADPTLNERQKQVLLQIYESFRKENGFEITQVDESDQGVGVDVRHADVQHTDVHADVHLDQDIDRDIGQSVDLDISDAGHPRSAADTAVRGSRTTGASDADPQQTAS